MSGSLAKGEAVSSIVIALTTGNEEFSATDRDVWIDLGPKAWKIPSGSLKRSATTYYKLDLITKDPDLDLPDVVPLLVDDLVRVRLEKKGICGWNNAGDNLVDAILQTILRMRASGY